MVYVSIRLYFNSLQWIQNKTSSSGGSAFRWSVSEGKRRALLEVTCLSLPFHLFFGLSCACFEKSRPQLWTGFLTVGAKTMHRIGRSDLPNDAPPPLQVWQKVKRGHSYLQVTSLSLPFHLVSFGNKESFFYLGTGLKTNYFPTSAKRRTQLEALFVLIPLKQIGS